MAVNNYESVTVADAAIGLTASLIGASASRTRCERVFATLETGQIRFRYDGTAPAVGEGHIMNIGDTLVLEGHQSVTDFSAIRTGATSGVLKVTFEYDSKY